MTKDEFLAALEVADHGQVFYVDPTWVTIKGVDDDDQEHELFDPSSLAPRTAAMRAAFTYAPEKVPGGKCAIRNPVKVTASGLVVTGRGRTLYTRDANEAGGKFLLPVQVQDKADAAEVALENSARREQTVADRVRYVRELKARKFNNAQIGEVMGLSGPQVGKYDRLGKGPQRLVQGVSDGEISLDVAVKADLGDEEGTPLLMASDEQVDKYLKTAHKTPTIGRPAADKNPWSFKSLTAKQRERLFLMLEGIEGWDKVKSEELKEARQLLTGTRVAAVTFARWTSGQKDWADIRDCVKEVHGDKHQATLDAMLDMARNGPPEESE